MANGGEARKVNLETAKETVFGTSGSQEFPQMHFLEEIHSKFGPDGEFWPSFVQFAVMLAAHFPDSILSITSQEGPFSFTLSFHEGLLAIIDDVGIRFNTDLPDQNWDGIYEGDVFAVTSDFLKDFSKLGFKIYEPRRAYVLGKPVRFRKFLEPNQME